MSGFYRILLPDSRIQTVTYRVDGIFGYVADIKYEEAGETHAGPYFRPPSESYTEPSVDYIPPPLHEAKSVAVYDTSTESLETIFRASAFENLQNQTGPLLEYLTPPPPHSIRSTANKSLFSSVDASVIVLKNISSSVYGPFLESIYETSLPVQDSKNQVLPDFKSHPAPNETLVAPAFKILPAPLVHNSTAPDLEKSTVQANESFTGSVHKNPAGESPTSGQEKSGAPVYGFHRESDFETYSAPLYSPTFQFDHMFEAPTFEYFPALFNKDSPSHAHSASPVSNRNLQVPVHQSLSPTIDENHAISPFDNLPPPSFDAPYDPNLLLLNPVYSDTDSFPDITVLPALFFRTTAPPPPANKDSSPLQSA